MQKIVNIVDEYMNKLKLIRTQRERVRPWQGIITSAWREQELAIQHRAAAYTALKMYIYKIEYREGIHIIIRIVIIVITFDNTH